MHGSGGKGKGHWPRPGRRHENPGPSLCRRRWCGEGGALSHPAQPQPTVRGGVSDALCSDTSRRTDCMVLCPPGRRRMGCTVTALCPLTPWHERQTQPNGAPVMKLLREGPHTACWQYALPKTRLVAASLSMLGVWICEPWPYLAQVATTRAPRAVFVERSGQRHGHDRLNIGYKQPAGSTMEHQDQGWVPSACSHCRGVAEASSLNFKDDHVRHTDPPAISGRRSSASRYRTLALCPGPKASAPIATAAAASSADTCRRGGMMRVC